MLSEPPEFLLIDPGVKQKPDLRRRTLKTVKQNKTKPLVCLVSCLSEEATVTAVPGASVLHPEAFPTHILLVECAQ